VGFQNYLTTNNYDIADYGDFGICNIMNYSEVGWMFTPQQKWGTIMTLENTNARWEGFTRPPNQQYYSDLTGESLTLLDGVLSWSRVTSDRRGAIGFPDRYVVYKGAGPSGPWTQFAWVAAESSVGVFPTSLSCDVDAGLYWKVRPRDLENAPFRYEATGADADWKVYFGFTTSPEFYNYGYKYKNLYE